MLSGTKAVALPGAIPLEELPPTLVTSLILLPACSWPTPQLVGPVPALGVDIRSLLLQSTTEPGLRQPGLLFLSYVR